MDDLISRQAAIDALMAWEEDSVWDDECLKHRGEPYWVAPSDVIERLPSAQSESKKGKWIEAYDPFNRISGRCSVCGWEAHLYEDDVVGMNYCPNCGADMREVSE